MSLKMFISHKISEQGETVGKLVDVLNTYAGPNELKIFHSTNIPLGENYRERLITELNSTDIFLLMSNYSSPPQINEWCPFEMGYFSSIADQKKKKLVSLVKKGGTPPDPVRDLQCVDETPDGIENLLRDIYNSDHNPLRSDLFDIANKATLDKIITEILQILEPKSKTIVLAPRIWITVKKEKFADFKNGIITLPMDSTIHGETEVFLENKVVSFEGKRLTLERFDEIVEYPPSIKPFFILLGEILHKIVNAPKKGPWRIPPIRIFHDKPPRIIVPASLEKSAGGDYIFEFFVSEPPSYTDEISSREFTSLYNLFIISWSFRWRVIQPRIKELMRKKNTFSINAEVRERKKNYLKKELKELYSDLNRITLDSCNRKIETETDVLDLFEGEDKDIIENIVDPKNGLWIEVLKTFYDTLEEELKSLNGEHVDAIIKCLNAWQDMNKTVLILTLNRLLKLTEDENIIQGKRLTKTTTIDELNNIKRQ